MIAPLVFSVPAAAQAPPVTGVCVMYCNTPPVGGVGGMGGVGSAIGVMGLGLSILGAVQEMNNQPATTAPAVAPAPNGSIALPQTLSPNLLLNQPVDPNVRASVLRQLRPVNGTYTTTEPAAPSTTSDLAAQRDAMLGQMRPIAADAPVSMTGAGASTGPSIDAQRASVLQRMRPLSNTSASNPNSAADQLCQAAHQGMGCIGTFTPHGMAAPSVAGSASGGGAAANAVGTAAAAGASDEALSMNARIPFDTPGNPVAGSDAPVIAGETPAVLGSGAGVVNRATLVADRQSVHRDLCTEFHQLKQSLDGYQRALRRLQATAANAASERKEWEDGWTEAGNDALDQAPGAFQLLLDVRVDQQIDRLSKEMGEVLDVRIDASGATRGAQDSRFKALYEEREKLKTFKEGIAKKTSELVAAKDVRKLWDSRDALDGLDQLLQMALDANAPGIGRAKAIAQLWYHATYDLASEYASWQAVAELNRQSQEYLHTVGELRSKIEGTVKKIKDAETQLKGESAAAGRCSA